VVWISCFVFSCVVYDTGMGGVLDQHTVLALIFHDARIPQDFRLGHRQWLSGSSHCRFAIVP
jgi:hypothetical protein